MKKLIYTTIVLLCFQLSLAASNDEVYKGLSNFTKVLDLIENNYVDEVESKKLTEHAINGMLSTLDPYSVYLSPENFNELEVDTYGEFGGLGIEVTNKYGQLTVISPIEDTPASRAGIKAGDVILAINGKKVGGISSVEAIRQLRGPVGSEVILSLRSKDEKEARDITLRREIVRIKSVRDELINGNIAYIKVLQFQKNSRDDFLRSYKKLNKQSGNKLNGLIIDLRNNPGGLLNQAVTMADDFIDEGLIVSIKGRNYEQSKEYFANNNYNINSKYTVVLVNEGSASAAEVLAGALKDTNSATIVGSNTFGKGSVQAIIKLDDGSGIKLTTARFFTPKGSAINKVGVVPDIIIKNDNKNNKDSQLDRAIELINNN